MPEIDIEFDFRLDSKCGDPDTDSQKLYELHKFLWSKELPNGKTFSLEIKGDSYGRLLLKNNLIMNMSSDRMCPHWVGKYQDKFKGWVPKKLEEELQHKVRTIGGHILFPAHRKNGFSINQARGINRKICDRFDLTLECIKRFYKNEGSPLFSSLKRYSAFFEVFVNFRGYTDFFLLQDFLLGNEVIFSIPFDNFKRNPLPENSKEYQTYIEKTKRIIHLRNLRILNQTKDYSPT